MNKCLARWIGQRGFHCQSERRGAQEYKDKTLTFVVGYSPGGSFDLYARVLARYIGRYLPGNPTRIVENMTGAGGIIAANHLYNRVKPDGLTVGAWASPLVLQHIMGNDAAQFDGRRFGYLGIPAEYDTVCTFNQKSGITKMEDWVNAKGRKKFPPSVPAPARPIFPNCSKSRSICRWTCSTATKAARTPVWRWSPARSTATAAPGARWRRSGAAPTKARK